MNDTEQDTAYDEFMARRRRTRPCKYYQTGTCWNTADECKWAHVYYRATSNPKRRPCKYYLDGFCARGQHCEFLHGNDPNRYYTPPVHQMELPAAYNNGHPYIYSNVIPLSSADYHHDSDNSYPSDNYPPSDPETATTDEVIIETGSHFDSDVDRAFPAIIPLSFLRPPFKRKDRSGRYRKHGRKMNASENTGDSSESQSLRGNSRGPNWRVISGGVIVGSTKRRERKTTTDVEEEEAEKIPQPLMPQRQTVLTVSLQTRRDMPVVDLKIVAPPVRPTSAPPTATPTNKPHGASAIFAAEA